MNERSRAERQLVFLEIVHELYKDQRDGKLSDGFVPPLLLALAVNKVADELYPKDMQMPEQPPQPDVRNHPFPFSGPEKEQGGAASRNEKTEIIEVPLTFIPDESGNE